MGTRFCPPPRPAPRNDADRGQTTDPVCSGGSHRGGYYRNDFYHRRNKRSLKTISTKPTKWKRNWKRAVKTIPWKSCAHCTEKYFLYLYPAIGSSGVGSCVLCARPAVGNEPFAVLLADDLIDSDDPVIRQMSGLYEQNRCSILGVQNIELKDTMKLRHRQMQTGETDSFRSPASWKNQTRERAFNAGGGRALHPYPEIFAHLERVKPGTGGESSLPTASPHCCRNSGCCLRIFRNPLRLRTKLGYLKATIALALKHPEVREEFAAHLAQDGNIRLDIPAD